MRKPLLLVGLVLLCAPVASAQHLESGWGATAYYAPVVDHRVGIWRHGVSVAGEYSFPGGKLSVGPRATFAWMPKGKYYGTAVFAGLHVARHFPIGRRLVPHVHVESGLLHESFVVQGRSVLTGYYGFGGSLGIKLNSWLTLQAAQWSHFHAPALGKRYEAASAGLTVRLSP